MRFICLKDLYAFVALLEQLGYKPSKSYDFKAIFNVHRLGYISNYSVNILLETNNLYDNITLVFTSPIRELKFIYEYKTEEI